MRFTLALATLLLVPLATAGLPAAVPVVAAGFNYASPALVIPAGTTVEWIGAALPHTVTTSATLNAALAGQANDASNGDGNPDSFNAPLPTGARFQHTFNVPGEFPYFCIEHIGRTPMVGTIVVK